MAQLPIDTYDFTVIRGDTFELSMGLTLSFVEVFETPGDYVGKLVFREEQDDTLDPLLILSVTPEVTSWDPGLGSPPQAVVYFTFTATDDQTQGLPQHDVVGYAELRTVEDDTLVQRLFNSRVAVRD